MLLLPQSFPEGGYAATQYLRPRKLAFIIPDDDQTVATRVIEECCLMWGGIMNLIIPHSSTGGISPDWNRILRFYDPDDIIDCLGIPDHLQTNLSLLGYRMLRWTPQAGQVFDWWNMPVYRILMSLPANDGIKNVLVTPQIQTSDSMSMPILARFGRINDDLFRSLVAHQFSGVSPNLSMSDILPVHEAEWDSSIDAVRGVLPLPTHRIDNNALYRYLSPLDLTRMMLSMFGITYQYRGGTPELPQYDEAYTDAIIVTGQPQSVQDLCLFWALRQQRWWQADFPLWIPLDVLSTPQGHAGVAAAVARARPRFGIPDRGLHVVSLSSTAAEVQAAADRLGMPLRVMTDDLYRFYSPDSRWGDRRETEVHFRQGAARTTVPESDLVRAMRGIDSVSLELEIDDYQVPQTKAGRMRVWGNVDRISTRGYVGNVGDRAHKGSFAFGVPSRWSALEGYCHARNFECKPSDKARIALAVIDLIGGMENLDILASTRILKLLIDMSDVRGLDDNKRSSRFSRRDRPEFSRAAIKKAIGTNQLTDAVITFFLERGLIFRGTNILCPMCRLKQWYALDRVGVREWRCDGCHKLMMPPLKPDNTQWSYRINELVARSIQQGVIVPLLTAVMSGYPRIPGARALGFYPGVLLRGVLDDEEPGEVVEIEVDFVEIAHGKLIIAEVRLTPGISPTRTCIDTYFYQTD